MTLRFDGWESAESWIRTLPEMPEDTWVYLTVVDRTQRDAPEVSIGRFTREVTPGDPFNGGPDDLVQWVREQGIGNAIGADRTVFRVRAWTLKGGASSAGSRQFVIHDDSVPGADDPWATMTPQQAESHATVQGLRYVGDHYKQFGDTVIATFDGLAKIHAITAQALTAELNTQRGQALAMFRAQLSDRRETSEQEALLQIHAQDAKVKETAITRGLSMLEAVGKLLATDAAGAAIPSDLRPALEIVNGSPELKRALNDPRIIKLLRDPTAQQGLAELLNELVEPDEPEAPAAAEDPFAPVEPSAPLHVVPPTPPASVHPSLANEPTINVAGDDETPQEP